MSRLTKQQIADAAAAELKATQQAELRRLRAEKAAATRKANTDALAKVAAHVADTQPAPEHADTDKIFEDAQQFLGQLPSAKRVMVGLVLSLVAAAGVGYGITMIAAYAIAGIVTLTATAWIAFSLSVLVYLVAVISGYYVGGYVTGKVFSSVVLPEGLAARSYESVKLAASGSVSSVKGWFARKPVEQFTGAYAS